MGLPLAAIGIGDGVASPIGGTPRGRFSQSRGAPGIAPGIPWHCGCWLQHGFFAGCTLERQGDITRRAFLRGPGLRP